MPQDYTIVTEVPGIGATAEQIERIYHRYNVASWYCADKHVLEVACGSGFGLGYLAQTASKVIGGDFTSANVRIANEQYRGRLDLLRLDALQLPFKDGCFDTLVVFEALYYFENPGRFIEECRRVLRCGGKLVLCTANKDWSAFNPSPFNVGYHSAPELYELISKRGFETEIFGAFPVIEDSLAEKAVSSIKRMAVSMHLMPQSMKGKQWLKRIFFGQMTPIPAELEWDDDYQASLTPLSTEHPQSYYKVLYAIASAK